MQMNFNKPSIYKKQLFQSPIPIVQQPRPVPSPVIIDYSIKKVNIFNRIFTKIFL